MGNMQFGTTNNAGSDPTDLTSSSSAQTLSVENSNAALTAGAFSASLTNASNPGDAVTVATLGDGNAIRATTAGGSGGGRVRRLFGRSRRAPGAVPVERTSTHAPRRGC